LSQESPAGAATLNFIQGPVNGIHILANGKSLLIHGDPRGKDLAPETVLFTHHRRDVVWAGEPYVRAGAAAVVPASEEAMFTQTTAFWQEWKTGYLQDFKQQTAQILVDPFPAVKTVKEGDVIVWQDLQIKVLETPGTTRGAVSYLFTLNNKKYACVGDLIYGDGKILDLYSLQDEIPEAKIGGYHGYMARAAQLIASLRKIAQEKPDILLPARGPIIYSPQESIEKLIQRLQAVYRNYLTTSALRWYFGDEHIQICAQRIIGDATIAWMPMAKEILKTPPAWILAFGTSRLLISASGNGFLLDCGSQSVIDKIKELITQGKLSKVDGIFVTHYHSDHTQFVEQASKEFQCPVYTTPLDADVLAHPQAYHLPVVTENAISSLIVKQTGETMAWEEFQFTFFDFPGQTLNHSALLVTPPAGEAMFFIGDSFTPSGLDDYCLRNRNLYHPDSGYFACLDTIRSVTPEPYLINQHVVEPFRYSAEQMAFLTQSLQNRVALLRDVIATEEFHYGVDDQWARFYPYGQTSAPQQPVTVQVLLTNHSSAEKPFTVTLNLPRAWNQPSVEQSITIPSRQEHALSFTITPPESFTGLAVLTADVKRGTVVYKHWIEALVDIQAPPAP
jgi:glyoxylase-like metal-dependent hydrolase (beta-lactamase superfamily II)